jgi:hypothetical protein
MNKVYYIKLKNANKTCQKEYKTLHIIYKTCHKTDITVKKLSVHFLAGAWTNERGHGGFATEHLPFDDRFFAPLKWVPCIFLLKTKPHSIA